jgi:hypothetical protein
MSIIRDFVAIKPEETNELSDRLLEWTIISRRINAMHPRYDSPLILSDVEFALLVWAITRRHFGPQEDPIREAERVERKGRMELDGRTIICQGVVSAILDEAKALVTKTSRN